jgi:prepilin-type N-terminal cleavage/methylation domain-containing protein
MTSRKGFTLIELMVVIFIVGILAAVAIPIMRGRIDAAKWSEGKAAAGSIRTAIRAYFAEKGVTYPNFSTDLAGAFSTFSVPLGFAAGDLTGKYFIDSDYAISGVSVVSGNLNYTITVTSRATGEAPTTPGSVTLKQDGTFSP